MRRSRPAALHLLALVALLLSLQPPATLGVAAASAEGMPGRPAPARTIPYHEPGRPARHIDGEAAPPALQGASQLVAAATLESGEAAPDPLAGNYRLVGLDNLVAAWGVPDGAEGRNRVRSRGFSALSEADVLVAPSPAGSEQIFGETRGVDSFDLATGDLNGDGQAEQIMAWRDYTKADRVQLSVGGLPGSLGRISADPAAVAHAGQLELFVRGYDEALWRGVRSGNAWSWEPLGGYLSSGPAAVSAGPDQLQVFARGSDGAIYSRARSGTTWADWALVGDRAEAIPAGSALVGDPAAAARSGGRIELFSRAADHSLRWRSLSGGVWGEWQSLGGQIASTPGAATLGDSVYLAARGPDGALWLRVLGAAGWGQWQWLGAPAGLSLEAAPDAAASGQQIVVAARTSDGALWQITGSGASWGEWQRIGGPAASAPAIAADGTTLHAFALDTRGALLQASRPAASWSALADQGGLPPCCVTLDVGLAANDGNSQVRVATGHFAGAGRQQILLAFEASDGVDGDQAPLELRLYDVEDGFRPRLLASYTDLRLFNDSFDLAVGDFNGDGRDEFAVIANYTVSGNSLTVFSAAPDAAGTWAIQLRDREIQGFDYSSDYRAALAAGDLNGDGRDDLVVCYRPDNDSSTDPNCHISTADNSLVLSRRSGWQVPPSDFFRLAAGDLDGDLRDEIVLAGNDGLVRVYDADNLSTGSPTATGSYFTTNLARLDLAVGDFNRDLKQEIALLRPAPTSAPNTTELRLEVITLNGNTLSTQNERLLKLELPYLVAHPWVALAAGDLGAGSLRVGPPSYRIESGVAGIVAIINDPPKHRDIIDGEVIDLYSGREGSSAGYATSTGAATTMSLRVQRAWGLQSELETTVGDEEGTHVTASIGASYGQEFEQGREQYSAITFGQNVETSLDDALVYSRTEYQVWEYPLYRDGGAPYDYLTVVFPVRRSDGSGTVQALDSGGSCESWYAPSHVPGNVWSYYPVGGGAQFPDYDPARELKSFSIGGAQTSFSLSWDELSAEDQASSMQLGISAGLEAQVGGDEIPVFPGVTVKVPFSVKASLSGSYDEASTSTHRVERTSSTAISGQLLGLSGANLYTVEPYIYWAKGGYLVVNYLTGPSAGSAVWSKYNRADPAFGLPWYGFPHPDPGQAEAPPCGEERKLLSRDIEISPAALSVGETATISATVRNFSNVGAFNVRVRFYAGDPADGGELIGERTIPALTGRARTTVSIDWQASGSGERRIYAVIDPGQSIVEVHDEADQYINNNTAYGVALVGAAGYVDPGQSGRAEYASLRYEGAPIAAGAAPAQVGGGLELGLHVPPENLSGATRFELVPQPTPELQTVGHPFVVMAYQGGQEQPSLSLRPSGSAAPAALSLAYTEAMLEGAEETQLALYRLQGTTWVQAACGEVQRFLAENRLMVPLCDTGTFALSAGVPQQRPVPVEQHRVWLPLLHR